MAPPQPELAPTVPPTGPVTGPVTDPATVAEVPTISPLTRFRVLALAAIVPPVVGHLAVAGSLALVSAGAPHANVTVAGVLAAAMPSWLAANQVPLTIDGVELGVLPLLPTLLVMVLAARTAARATTRLGFGTPRESAVVIGTIACAHGLCGLAVSLAHPDRSVEIDPLAALYYPALIAGLASVGGALRRGGLVGAMVDRADTVALRGLASGAIAVVLLLASGAAVLSFGLLTSAATVADLFAGFAPDAGAGFGLLLLCLGYLPNAVVAGTAFVAGPGFAIGDVVVSPLEFTGGRVPGLPLLAALPEEQAPWWPLLWLLPVAIGVAVGRRLRHVAERPMTRLRAVAVAVGVVAVVIVLLAASAGGRLGGGAFDPVTMRASAVSLALVLAVGVPAAIVVWFGGRRTLSPSDHTDDRDDDRDDGPHDGPDDIPDDGPHEDGHEDGHEDPEDDHEPDDDADERAAEEEQEPAKAGDRTGGPAG